MTTKTPIFMNIAYLNGNFDGKLAKNLADGSVGRGGDFCPRPLYVTPSDFSAKTFRSNLEVTDSRTTIQPGDGFKLFSSPRTAGLGG